MTIPQTKFHLVTAVLLLLLLSLVTPSSLTARLQDDEGGSRHICPKEALRNGTCDPNPNRPATKTSSGPKPRKEPRYTRVAKQPSTTMKCNVRVQQAQNAKSKNKCEVRLPPSVPDLPLTAAQKIGVTIWRLREAREGYEGARILSHPKAKKTGPEYGAERIDGQPVLSYGDLVRMSVESPRNGFLYVFNRELYADGSLSNPYLIFPTTRLRGGNNRIMANQPIEIPATTDEPFYFEAKRAGLDGKKMVGEILSIVITDKPISDVGPIGSDAKELSDNVMTAIEDTYAGRAEVFELEEGIGLAYSTAEHKAANDEHARLLTHKDPVPQTFYLVEEKRRGGLLVTVALSYKG